MQQSVGDSQQFEVFQTGEDGFWQSLQAVPAQFQGLEAGQGAERARRHAHDTIARQQPTTTCTTV